MTVTQFVADKIAALRIQHAQLAQGIFPAPLTSPDGQTIPAPRDAAPGQYENVSVIRANAMKFLPNFFEKAQVCVTTSSSSRQSLTYSPFIAFKDILPLPRSTLQSTEA